MKRKTGINGIIAGDVSPTKPSASLQEQLFGDLLTPGPGTVKPATPSPFASAFEDDDDDPELCEACEGPMNQWGECRSNCVYCDHCGDKVAEDFYCYHSQDEEHICHNCCPHGGNHPPPASPGWLERQENNPEHVYTPRPVAEAYGNDMMSLYTDLTSTLEPATEMATFYLAEYVLAHPTPPGADPSHRTYFADLQQDTIDRCDLTFRMYAWKAIAGELRHHSGTQKPYSYSSKSKTKTDEELAQEYTYLDSGTRSGTGTRFFALQLTHNPVQLLEDACALFSDYDAWESGYGGEAWKACTDIALKRENGTLDPRTFVDRCFALEHNGGSFLNKADWRTPDRPWRHGVGTYGKERQSDDCKFVGDAHHANPTDLHTLLDFVDRTVKDRFYAYMKDYNRNVRHLGPGRMIQVNPSLAPTGYDYDRPKNPTTSNLYMKPAYYRGEFHRHNAYDAFRVKYDLDQKAKNIAHAQQVSGYEAVPGSLTYPTGHTDSYNGVEWGTGTGMIFFDSCDCSDCPKMVAKYLVPKDKKMKAKVKPYAAITGKSAEFISLDESLYYDDGIAF